LTCSARVPAPDGLGGREADSDGREGGAPAADGFGGRDPDSGGRDTDSDGREGGAPASDGFGGRDPDSDGCDGGDGRDAVASGLGERSELGTGRSGRDAALADVDVDVGLDVDRFGSRCARFVSWGLAGLIPCAAVVPARAAGTTRGASGAESARLVCAGAGCWSPSEARVIFSLTPE
jgi:hypothetical protein